MLFIMILSPNLLGPEQENSDNYIQKTLKGRLQPNEVSNSYSSRERKDFRSELRKLTLSGGQNSLEQKLSKDNTNIPFRYPVVQGRLDPIKPPSQNENNEMRSHT